MLDIQSISVVVAAVGVIVGVILAVMQLRNIARTRQTQLIMNIYSRFGTREYANALESLRTREYKHYQDYAEKYGVAEIIQVCSVFEGLGYLMHRNLIDKDLVCEILSESTMMTWEKVKPMIEDARKQIAQRKSGEYTPVYRWWEYMYNEVKKRVQTLLRQK